MQAHLDVFLGIKEQVEGLYVSVDDLLAVYVVQTCECLHTMGEH
jgi:hypothetical protein